MSIEAHLLPLERFLRGDYRAPMEKFCRGKGVALFDVQRSWRLVPDAARSEAHALWRLATGGPPPSEPDVDALAELIDSEGLALLRIAARTRPDRGAGSPHLLATNVDGECYLPVPFDPPQPVVLTGGVPVWLGSAIALRAELEHLAGGLGPVRDWADVPEGEFACAHDDPRFAEKTAWSILRFLARESERRGLPLFLVPSEE